MLKGWLGGWKKVLEGFCMKTSGVIAFRRVDGGIGKDVEGIVRNHTFS